MGDPEFLEVTRDILTSQEKEVVTRYDLPKPCSSKTLQIAFSLWGVSQDFGEFIHGTKKRAGALDLLGVSQASSITIEISCL